MEALRAGRIQTRLGVDFVTKFLVEFSSDFFNLLVARFHQAKIICSGTGMVCFGATDINGLR